MFTSEVILRDGIALLVGPTLALAVPQESLRLSSHGFGAEPRRAPDVVQGGSGGGGGAWGGSPLPGGTWPARTPGIMIS